MNTFAEIAHFPSTLSPTSYAAICHVLTKDEDLEI